MATSAKNAAKPADPTVPQNSKKKMFIMIGAAAAVAIAGGAGWFFAKGKGGEHHEEVKAAPVRPPIFMPLQANPFLANLQPEKAECRDTKKHDESLNCIEQYIQVAISIKYFEPGLEAAVKLNLPEINSKILQLLTTKTARELLSQEGKAKLAKEIVFMCNTILGTLEPVAPVVVMPPPAAASAVEHDGQTPDAAAIAAAVAVPPPPPAPRPLHERKGVVDALFTSFIIQ